MNKKQTRSAYLSKKDIPVNERLIFALDVPTVFEAKEIVDELDDDVHFYKLGLELFMAGGYYELIQWLKEKEKKFSLTLNSSMSPKLSALLFASLKAEA